MAYLLFISCIMMYTLVSANYIFVLRIIAQYFIVQLIMFSVLIFTFSGL